MSGGSFGRKDQELGKFHMIYVGAFALFIFTARDPGTVGGRRKARSSNLFPGLHAGQLMPASELYRGPCGFRIFHVAGHSVPPFYNGMAIGADWMSGTILHWLLPAHSTRWATTAWPMSSAGPAALCLFAVLFCTLSAQAWRLFCAGFSCMCVFGGGFARFLGVIVLLCCSFVILVAQLSATGIIAARFPRPAFRNGRRPQAFARYPRMLDTRRHERHYLDAVGAVYRHCGRLPRPPSCGFSSDTTGVPIPQSILRRCAEADFRNRDQCIRARGRRIRHPCLPNLAMFETYDRFNFLALVFCLMAGNGNISRIS